MNVKKIVFGGLAATALGIAALAGTGTAFASAPTANTHQTSTVQQGNQSTPDTAASNEKAGVDGDNVQQGDQSSPDTAASAEKAGAESGVSDGPGGHADAGGSSVDHQFEDNE